MAVQVLIVDDRAVVRKELRNLFALTADITVAGEAADGWEALYLARALQPDIVLMDLEMPEMDGYEATRRIKAQGLARAVIVFTVYASDANRQKALEAGADAFVVKGANLGCLLDLFAQFSHGQEEGSKGKD